MIRIHAVPSGDFASVKLDVIIQVRSSSQAATCYYQSNHSNVEAIPLSAFAQGHNKGAEASPLAKSKTRKNIKYRIVLIFFVSQ